MSSTLLDEVVHGSIAPVQRRREQIDHPWTVEEVRDILATTTTLLQAIVHLFEQHCEALLDQGLEASKIIAGLEQLIERHALILPNFEESRRFARKTGFEAQVYRELDALDRTATRFGEAGEKMASLLNFLRQPSLPADKVLSILADRKPDQRYDTTEEVRAAWFD